MLRREPRAFGIADTRWTLAHLHAVCDWLHSTNPRSLAGLLARLDIRWKRGREHIHSPDDDYVAKLASIAVWLDAARGASRRHVLLYLDECTYYRQPTLANAYEARGGCQPLAERSHRSNTPTRLLASLDARDGRVLYRQGSKIGLAELVGFYRRVRQVYAAAERIYVVQDNWPVHFHPDVLVALQPQASPFPRYLPRGWATEPSREAVRKWGDLRLPMQLLPLPTYASWANPIEKLWRKLRQDVLHLHRFADRLDELHLRVSQFLDQFANGSEELLRYVGLFVPR